MKRLFPRIVSDVWPAVTGENRAETSLEWWASFQLPRAALRLLRGLCFQASHNTQSRERQKETAGDLMRPGRVIKKMRRLLSVIFCCDLSQNHWAGKLVPVRLEVLSPTVLSSYSIGSFFFLTVTVPNVCSSVMDLPSRLACLLLVLHLPGSSASLIQGEQSDIRLIHKCSKWNKIEQNKMKSSEVKRAKNRRLWVGSAATYGNTHPAAGSRMESYWKGGVASSSQL